MMRIYFILFIALLGFSAPASAQTPIPQGASQLNFGAGLSSVGIPVYVGFDVGARHDLSFGGEASFRYKYEKWKQVRYRNNVIGISANGNYHFNRLLHMSSMWDLYAGLNLGFFIWNDAPGYDGPRSTGLGLGPQFGGRIYFSDKMAINLEFGSRNEFSGGKIGLTVRL